MPSFYLLREFHSHSPRDFSCTVSFGQILEKGYPHLPYLIIAESPENALQKGKKTFPLLSNFLAVQEIADYDHSQRPLPLLRSPKTQSAGP